MAKFQKKLVSNLSISPTPSPLESTFTYPFVCWIKKKLKISIVCVIKKSIFKWLARMAGTLFPSVARRTILSWFPHPPSPDYFCTTPWMVSVVALRTQLPKAAIQRLPLSLSGWSEGRWILLSSHQRIAYSIQIYSVCRTRALSLIMALAIIYLPVQAAAVIHNSPDSCCARLPWIIPSSLLTPSALLWNLPSPTFSLHTVPVWPLPSSSRRDNWPRHRTQRLTIHSLQVHFEPMRETYNFIWANEKYRPFHSSC